MKVSLEIEDQYGDNRRKKYKKCVFKPHGFIKNAYILTSQVKRFRLVDLKDVCLVMQL